MQYWIMASKMAKAWMEVEGCKHDLHPEHCSLCNRSERGTWISVTKILEKEVVIPKKMVIREFKGDPKDKVPIAIMIPEWKAQEIMFGDPEDEFPMPAGDLALFDDREHGEGWLGMALHVHDMNGMERIINEDCYAGIRVSHPRLDFSDGKIFWQRGEWVAKKLDCDAVTASRLIEAWKFMDYNTEIVMDSIKGLQKYGVAYGFAKTMNWAYAVSKVEEEMEIDPNDDPEEHEYRVPGPFKWIPLGERDTEDPTSWLDKQPMWVKIAIGDLKEIDDIDKLAKFGKEIYAIRTALTADQSGVFWTEYNIRKKILSKRLEPKFWKLFKFVRKTTNMKVGFMGKYLYNLQKSGRLELTNRHWKMVWKAWNIRKRNSVPEVNLEEVPMPNEF